MPEDAYRRMEEKMGVVLRTGVITCCAIMLVAGVLLLLRHGGEAPNYHTFHGEPGDLETIPGIFGQVMHGSARGMIQAGALLMIATPIMRVVFAVFGFARIRDWKFVSISLVVLGLLIFGLNK